MLPKNARTGRDIPFSVVSSENLEQRKLPRESPKIWCYLSIYFILCSFNVVSSRAETPLLNTKLDSGSNLSLEEGKRCCCLALAPASYGAQAGRMALAVGPLKTHESKVVMQQWSEERPVSLWSGMEKIQSTRLISKGQSTP